MSTMKDLDFTSLEQKINEFKTEKERDPEIN